MPRWLGVGLASIAALMLLVAEGNLTLRVAALFSLVAAVLIGFSSTLAGGGGRSRSDFAASLAEQRAEIRGEVRAEVTAAAHATHRMIGEHLEHLRSLRDEVEALRGQVDAIWAGAARLPEGGHGVAKAGFAAIAAADAAAVRYGGGQQRGAAGIGVAAVPPPASTDVRTSSGRATVPAPGGAPRPQVPTGVVRHTETVQVMTRHTIVEPDGDRPEAGYTSGDYGPAPGWTVPRQRRRSADRGPDPATGGHREDIPPEPGRLDGDHDAVWTRARDRWATVHDDGDGREVRLGQRRARIRADETGTELQFEDRWAAVREAAPDRQEARRGGWRSARSSPDEHGSYSAEPEPSGSQAVSDLWTRQADGDDSGHRWAESADRWGDKVDGDDRWAEAESRAEQAERGWRGAEQAERGWRGADQADRVWTGSDLSDHKWTDGDRSDRSWSDRDEDDRGPTDQGWSHQSWSGGHRGWSGNDRGLDGPASLDPAGEQPARAALPAGGGAAHSWSSAWSEPDRQPVRRGHRYRDDSDPYGFPRSDGVPRAGGRPGGLERSENRWG